MKNVGKEILNAYEAVAEKYDLELWDDMPYNAQMDTFVSLVKGHTILDMGCAMGSFTKYIADKGYEVDGIDFSPKFIEIAEKKVPNVQFYVMDMLDMHLDKTYDGIMLINSMIHIEKKEMVDLFKKVKSLLNEDGVCFVILQEGIGEQYVEEPLDPTISEFVNFYQKEEIEQVFKESGFTVIGTEKIRDEAEFELGNDQLVYYLK